MPRFAGKVAIVTGGPSGIGESIVRLLVEEGGSVVIAGSEGLVNSTLDKPPRFGGQSRHGVSLMGSAL